MGQVVIGVCDRKGQDCSAKFVNETAGIRGSILADGLGSCLRARETAEFIVQDLCTQLEATQELRSQDLNELFSKIHERLLVWVAENAEAEPSMDPREYGSTLIVTIETTDRFIIAYVGNGAIWHIRGNAFLNHGNRIMPWSITNLLNPHTVPENGVEALYKYFSASKDPESVQPTILELSKDYRHGDIIFACTDGISSNDQVAIGRVPSGAWTNVEEAFLLFLEHLRIYLEAPQTVEELKKLNDNYLNALDEAAFVEDDASFGIIISLPNECNQ